MTDDNIRRRSGEQWGEAFTKDDLDFLQDKHGEIRYEFEEDLNSFLDRAYRDATPGRPVGNRTPATSPTDLMLQMKQGIRQFERGDWDRSSPAFAVLINPVDKMGLQDAFAEATGTPITDLMGGQDTFKFEGCVVQAATFIDEGKYLVISRADYTKLVEQNREHLE